MTVRIMRLATLLLCGSSLGGCAVGIGTPLAPGQVVTPYGTGPGVYAPSGPVAAYGQTPSYGQLNPYGGGPVTAPAVIFPRSTEGPNPGLPAGVTPPPVVQTGRAAGGAPLAGLPGAGPVVDVRETRYANGVAQDVVYAGAGSVAGENRVTVKVMETSYNGLDDGLRLAAPTAVGIDDEIRTLFPVGSMTVSEDIERDAGGVFGHATGRLGAMNCIYAWQFIEPPSRRTIVDDLAGLQGYDASVRVRFCGRASAAQELAMVRGLRFGLARLGGSQGLFEPARASTVAAVVPGPVPLVAQLPAAPYPDPTAASSPGAMTGAAPALAEPVFPSGYGGVTAVGGGMYVPLPGSEPPVEGVPRPRPRVRAARHAPGRRHARVDLGPDVDREVHAVLPTYRGAPIRTVRRPGGGPAAPARGFVPLPSSVAPPSGAVAPAPSPGSTDLPVPVSPRTAPTSSVAPVPGASRSPVASIDGMPLPR